MAKLFQILPLAGALLLCGCPKKKTSDTADAGALASSASASATAAPSASASAVAEDPTPPSPAQSPTDVPGHHEADKKAQGEITKDNYKSVLGDLEKKAK